MLTLQFAADGLDKKVSETGFHRGRGGACIRGCLHCPLWGDVCCREVSSISVVGRCQVSSLSVVGTLYSFGIR